MTGQLDIREFHWLLDVVQSIDVGIVVLDREYKVQVWNGFMENHSGIRPEQVRDRVFFEVFPEVPAQWFRQKLDTVMLLNNRAFTTWEQREQLLKFKNYRPITGTEPHMFQNLTIIPLASARGIVDHVALIIYDVTDIAVNRKQLQAANAQLEILSRTDRLTQLWNRGHWEECLKREFAVYKRYKTPVSLIMFDIDHFKKVNDTYGHQAGDEVIQCTAKCVSSSLRNTDIAGRYGGEEFAVILPNTDTDNAALFAERLRKFVSEQVVTNNNQTIRWTISLGICECNIAVADYKRWIESADQALYQSKLNGRNRVSIHGVSP